VSQEYPRSVQLLLTDVVMPRMNGRELAERLLRARPGLKVLYVSGYGESIIAQNGVIDSAIALLQKPITPQALLRKVREVLDS
jgi:FixJ family two-component response regulator